MAYKYDPINKILTKTKDAGIKFINEGQKFRNKAGVEIKLTEVIPNRVQYSIYRDGKLSENSKTSDPETMIKILNRNGYVPMKDFRVVDMARRRMQVSGWQIQDDIVKRSQNEIDKLISNKDLHNAKKKNEELLGDLRDCLGQIDDLRKFLNEKEKFYDQEINRIENRRNTYNW